MQSCLFFCSLPYVRPLAGMAANHIRRVLAGDVTDLPRKDSNIVRIFTSSTFTGIYFCQPSKLTVNKPYKTCIELNIIVTKSLQKF